MWISCISVHHNPTAHSHILLITIKYIQSNMYLPYHTCICIRFCLVLILFCQLNSLFPGIIKNYFKGGFLNSFCIDVLIISYEIALKGMPQNPFDDMPTLVQVMAWCRQATSHDLNHRWPRTMSPCGVTRPQWVLNSSGQSMWSI